MQIKYCTISKEALGAHVFSLERVSWRWQNLLLRYYYISQVQHVVPGIPPKPDAFAMDSVYQALLSRTLQVRAWPPFSST